MHRNLIGRAMLAATCALALTACHSAQQPATPSATHQRTTQTLTKRDQVWRAETTATATVSPKGQLSGQTAKADTTLGPWVTNNGRFYDTQAYTVTDYATVKKALRANESQPERQHFATVAQVNQTLKALGATKRINALRDLITLKTASGTVSPDGFVTQGDHLYAVSLDWVAGSAAGTVTRGTAYTRALTYQATGQPKRKALDGTWQAADGSIATVYSGAVITVQNAAYVRGAIEDLSQLKPATVYGNLTTYMRISEAARAGVKLSASSLAAGDIWGNLYVFLSPTTMVRATSGTATVFTKKDAVVTTPAEVTTLFQKLDAQGNGTVPAYLLPKIANTYSVGLVSNIKYLTANGDSNLVGAESASLDGDTLNVGADMNHN